MDRLWRREQKAKELYFFNIYPYMFLYPKKANLLDKSNV